MRNYKKDYPRRFHPAKAFFFALMAIAFVLVFGGIVMFLWNAILPEVIGAKPLTWLQAMGLLVLFRILFGGFHWGSHKGRSRHSRRRYWKDKWMRMNEEERTEFKQQWKQYCNRKKEPPPPQ